MLEMEESFDLLRLPDLAKAHICDFLDVSSLMNLRLTCKDLKAVVEQPSVLVKLPIKITFSKQLQRILESQVPYNNFILSFLSLEDQTYFNDFVEKFAEGIRKLKVKNTGGYQKIAFLLKNCSVQLEELEVDVLGVSIFAGNDDLLNTVLNNFRNLRKLLIHELRGQDNDINAIEVYLKMLQNCGSQLTEFKIPYIQAYNDKLSFVRFEMNQRRVPLANAIQGNDVDNILVEEDWEQGEEQPRLDPLPQWNPTFDRDILIHPVVDYIRCSRSGQPQKVKRIDVSSIKHFRWKSFKELLAVCYEKGIQLSNVNSSQLLDLRSEILSENKDYCCLFESAKVTRIHDGFPLSYMDNLCQLYLLLDPTDEHQGLAEGDTLSLPQLTSLRVQFMFGENMEHGKILIKKLFNEFKRPTVRKLHMEWYLLESCKTISVNDVTDNFRNLTELILDGWDAVDDDFNNLWSNLLELQKVSIKDCKNLNNRAFVGRYKLSDPSNIPLRPLNRLKKLHTLIIRDTTGNVNDVAILGSFRWISLRYFEFDTTRTLKIGWELYSKLSSTPLGKSVEYFKAPQPLPHRFFNEKNVARKFKNLKRRRLV